MFLLGKISVATVSAQNNHDTATPFVIPAAIKALYLQSDTDGVQYELGQPNTFHTTAARGAFIPASGILVGPVKTNGCADILPLALGNTTPAGVTSAHQGGSSQTAPTQPTTTLSIYNPTGSTAVVQVYAAAGG